MSNIKVVEMVEKTEDEQAQALKEGVVLERGKQIPGVRRFIPKTKEQKIEQYFTDERLREKTLEDKISLISPAISRDFYLSPGLILMGGVSGNGKSTVLANMVAGYMHIAPKNIVVISNEESTAAVNNRIACIELGYSFYDYHHNRLPPSKIKKVQEFVQGELTDKVEVVNDTSWDMTCLEDVISVFEYAAHDPSVGLVFIDYFQTVTFSRQDPQKSMFGVLKDLGSYLLNYGKRVAKPVVTFAQLKAQQKEKPLEFKERVENDKQIFNHAFQVIEIVPDFQTKITKFKVYKDRYGSEQTREMEALFDNGTYKPVCGNEDSV